MVLVLKSGATKKNIKNVLADIDKSKELKGVNTFEFVGKINLKKDVLEIQKTLRNEW